MNIALRGSSAGATTAGIFLLTKARQLGLPLRVSVVGQPDDAAFVKGPAMLYAPVLASCGVGRDHGHGALVIVPGPPSSPLLMSATPHGVDGWFEVDRSGSGCHPGTEAFVRMSNDARVPARHLGKEVRRALTALGMSPEPAVLDILFGADVPPLTRLSLALRAGRALSGGRGEPITRYLTGNAGDEQPLTADEHPISKDDITWVLDGLSTAVRDRAEEWADAAIKLAEEDDGRDTALLYRLAEMAGHLAGLPQHCILPPLGAAEDSVAVGLKMALTATGEGDANQQLIQTFKFLGGKYVDDDPHAVDTIDEPPPGPEDTIGRWQWFSRQARVGRKRAEAIWPDLVDPPS
ncbi:MAG: hypothetical protein ACJATT_003769 [Myxococcota bacterium]|jgi:hypothetical protein